MTQYGLFLLASLLSAVASAASLPDLRILPLGDSITAGSGSSTGNGYRAPLWDLLEPKADSIDFVGTQQRGNMTDNDHEGWSGRKIADMIVKFRGSMAAMPNVILLHIGINDMDTVSNLATCPIQYEALLDTLHDQFPKAALVVMPIVDSTKPRVQNNTETFNEILTEEILPKRQDKGWRLEVVPVKLAKDEHHDYLHPNDKGHARIAQAWAEGIEEAGEKGWIEEPEELNMTTVTKAGLGTKAERVALGLEKGKKDKSEEDPENGVGKILPGFLGSRLSGGLEVAAVVVSELFLVRLMF